MLKSYLSIFFNLTFLIQLSFGQTNLIYELKTEKKKLEKIINVNRLCLYSYLSKILM